MNCSVLGLDFSTRAIDIVALDKNTNAAEWLRVELEGESAWERTLSVPRLMPDASWYDYRGVFLAAIETPVNDQKRVLSRVQGAVMASLPAKLRHPHSCWDVHPSTWKAGLGLKGKPTADDIERVLPGCELEGMLSTLWPVGMQDTWDALALAAWARDTNARAVEQALKEPA
jgi:hypothetical protein